MIMECDDKATAYIANNLVFHKRTKHIDVDFHYTHDMIQSDINSTYHVTLEAQVAYIFIKPLPIGYFLSVVIN